MHRRATQRDKWAFLAQEEGDWSLYYLGISNFIFEICQTTIKYKTEGVSLVSKLSWKIPSSSYLSMKITC